MFCHFTIFMYSMQCVEGYMVTLKVSIMIIRLDKKRQLHPEFKDLA